MGNDHRERHYRIVNGKLMYKPSAEELARLAQAEFERKQEEARRKCGLFEYNPDIGF
jgi:hypothetical protein